VGASGTPVIELDGELAAGTSVNGLTITQNLLENGAAVKVNNLASLGHKISALLSEPGRLESMRAAARRLARPRAAFDVAEQCLALLEIPQPAPVVMPRARRFWRTRMMVGTR